jgi:hypothetical protein
MLELFQTRKKCGKTQSIRLYSFNKIEFAKSVSRRDTNRIIRSATISTTTQIKVQSRVYKTLTWNREFLVSCKCHKFFCAVLKWPVCEDNRCNRAVFSLFFGAKRCWPTKWKDWSSRFPDFFRQVYDNKNRNIGKCFFILSTLHFLNATHA